MNRTHKKTKLQEIRAYSKIFVRLDDFPIDAYYHFEKYKFSKELKRQKYIIHIIFPDTLNIAKVKLIFEAEAKIVPLMKIQYPEISMLNSFVFTIIDVTRGLRFIPDIKMIENIYGNKSYRESMLGVTFGGVSTVLPIKNKRIIDICKTLLKVFSPKYPEAVFSNIEDAYKRIDNLNELIY